MLQADELARDQARILQPVRATDRQIITFLDAVDAAVIKVEFKRQFRVLLEEAEMTGDSSFRVNVVGALTRNTPLGAACISSRDWSASSRSSST